MTETSPLFFVGKGTTNDHFLLGAMANRHGLIAGATGTGKTVTLRVLVEALSNEGVPVFLSDVKGDLGGLAKPIVPGGKIQERVATLSLGDVYQPAGFPVVFWDVYGELGHPLRATISDLGPILLARLLDLNDTQSDVLSVIFKIADDRGLLLLDLKDLQAVVQVVTENLKEVKTEYGNISPATVGAIQRDLIVLEQQGGGIFFGEPTLEIADLFARVPDGRGVVNVLAAEKLLHEPKLYATFLLWLLAELFENLPEVGDQDLPKLVFFFDEAHLLFNDAPKPLLEKIEQVVRLIRSKGVGVWFCTQQPTDIPEAVAGQLGNRVQHALRAFTERDRKAVKAAAQTFRTESGDRAGAANLQEAITTLGVGEAIVSFLDEKGQPTIAEAVLIAPPRTQLDPLDAGERQQVMAASPVRAKYDRTLDRVSAYEMLKERADAEAQEEQREAIRAEVYRREQQDYEDELAHEREREQEERRRSRQRATPVETFFQSAARGIGGQVGRQIVRGVLGSLFGGGGSRRRRG